MSFRSNSRISGIFVLSVVLLTGCFLSPFHRELKLKNEETAEAVRSFWIEDLNGDGEEEILLLHHYEGLYSGITIRDRNFEVYSQMNDTSLINRLTFCDVDVNGDEEIFISGHTPEREVYLNEINYTWQKNLERSDKALFSWQRCDNLPEDKPYSGSFGVEFCTNLDNDDNRELVLRGASGFSGYPRGLWVIDETTGEMEWSFQTAGNLRDILFYDINQDGDKEFIFSTQAFKNTQEDVNQTDDYHSYLFVLDKQGKELFREEIASGFSRVDFFLEDVDADGLEEVISVKTTWGKQLEKNGIYIYKWLQGRLSLMRMREFEIPFSRKSTACLEDIDNNGKKELLLVNDKNKLLVFDYALQIVNTYEEEPLNRLHKVIDLDCDGKPEIILETKSGGLHILNTYLQKQAEFDDINVADSRLSFFNPGFGQHKLLVIFHNGKFSFYEYSIAQLPVWQYMLYILVFFAIIGLIVLLIKYRKQALVLMSYRGAYNKLDIAALIFNNKGKITYCSEQFKKLCPYEKKVRYLSDFNCDIAEILQREFISYRRSSRVKWKCRFTEPINERYLEAEFKTLTLKKEFHLLIVKDSTDLQELQQKADWAETARGLSHGIRKHLNNILLAAERISSSSDENAKKLSPIIIDEANKMKYFVQSFQRFTEVDKLKLHKVNTNLFVSNYMAKLLPDIPCKIKLVSEIEHDLPPIKVDNVRLAEILNNLINNSLEAISDKGKIILRVYLFEQSSSCREVRFEVSDTGSGIPQEIINDLFVPYFTTKEGGTGIGLPLARKLVNEFNGKIEIESRIDVGTTVRIILPAAEGSEYEEDPLS